MAEKREGIDGQAWIRNEDGVVSSTPRDPSTLEALRKEALAEMNANSFVFRSCWQCNGAHEHFLSHQDWVLRCFGCGRIYYKGVDLTDWDEKPAVEEEGSQP